jgi:formylglycine-generating enzyme
LVWTDEQSVIARARDGIAGSPAEGRTGSGEPVRVVGERLMVFLRSWPILALLVVMAAAGTGFSAEADRIAQTGGHALRVPVGCRAVPGTISETYSNTGWAKEIVHEKTGVRLVFIPAGEFRMGSNTGEEDQKPVHFVRITQPFYLGKCEITVDQFRAFVQQDAYQTDAEASDGARGWTLKGRKLGKEFSWRNPGYIQEDLCPAPCISWHDAQSYCRWAGLRLPTEAEWEYACRAGSETLWPWGDKEQEAGKYANVSDRTLLQKHPADVPFDTDDGYVTAAPVGNYKPNGFGLHDMIGNVWEWCSDWYGENYYRTSPPADPPGPDTGDEHVMRGGCASTPPWVTTAFYRGRNTDANSYSVYGFRVVKQCLPPGLVAHFRLDGSARDASEYANHGVVVGAKAVNDRKGVPNAALSFDGVGDYVEIGKTAAQFMPQGDFTISLWASLRPYDGKDRDIFVSGEHFTTVTIRQVSEGLMFRIMPYRGSTRGTVVLTAKVAPGEGPWHHLATTKCGHSIAAYVDGNLIGQGALPVKRLSYPEEKVYIGTFKPGVQPFKGAITDVRVYDAALTHDDITQLFRQ